MSPVVTTATGLTGHKTSQLVRHATAMVGHLGHDFSHAPAMVQADAVILSTLALVTARVSIAFSTAAKETDPEQSVVRWREAIRTGMREIGGWVCSYLVLKAVRQQAQHVINKGVGLVPVARPAVGFGKFAQDMKAQLVALLSHTPLPTPQGNSLQALEFIPDVAFAQRSVFKSGLQQLQKTPLFKGMNVDCALKLIHSWGPITVGSLASLALSGFMLEWFTLHHADNVAKLVTQVTDRRKIKPKEHPEPNPTMPVSRPSFSNTNRDKPLASTSFSASSVAPNTATPPAVAPTAPVAGAKPDPFAWAYANAIK
jgi:hypothetical protein